MLAAIVADWVWPLLQFLIGLGLVVFVHELGHFLVAKWAGIKVEEFALGFGKRLFGIRRGETDYRVNMVPLGGYVKMLGQDDFNPGATAEADPRSWQRAKPYKRILVLAAGVTMNVIFAALVFVVVYMVGKQFAAPLVGAVAPNSPAARAVLPDQVARAMGVENPAGLRRGDRVLSINGRPIRKFEQIKMAGALSRANVETVFGIRRMIEGRPVEFEVGIQTAPRETAELGTQYFFGIEPMLTLRVLEAKDGKYVGDQQLKHDDVIVAVGGQGVSEFWQVEDRLLRHGDGPVALTARRDGQNVDVTFERVKVFGLAHGQGLKFLDLAGMEPRVQVHGPGDVAEAGVKAGDVIVSYGGVEDPSRRELADVSKANLGQATPLVVLRAGQRVDLTVEPRKGPNGQALIGLTTEPEYSTPFVSEVEGDSPAGKAGIEKGAVIQQVNGRKVQGWPGVLAALAENLGKSVTIAYKLGDEEKTADLGVVTSKELDLEQFQAGLPVTLATYPVRTEPIKGGPLQALRYSIEDTREWVLTSYATLARIFEGRVGIKGLSGPVGIGAIAVLTAREGPVDFMYLMAMLSVMVAVFNFLPLPVLDGGHVVLVLIEKVRGRPLPPKVVNCVQFVGLALILGLFLIVTFQDILRIVKLK